MTAAFLPTPVARQREVLYLPAHGHTVVLGTAGSGKTTLAILRSLYLSDPSTAHAGRTLLVTFNKCLVTYMEHLAGTMRRPVDVRNYHHFARGYLDFRNKLPSGSICNPSERLRFIESAGRDSRAAGVRSPILQHPTKFLDEEFQWIQRHGIGSATDYVDAERTGRSTRVRKADRADLFDLHERYLARRRQASCTTGTTWPAPCAGNSTKIRARAFTVTWSSTRDRIFRRRCCGRSRLQFLATEASPFSATSPSRYTATGCRGETPD